MASSEESYEFKIVKGNFVAICHCISEPDVVEFSGNLFQSGIVSDAGHQAAIAVTGTPPNTVVARVVSEAMNKVSNSPDKFLEFVSILESRNKKLATAMRSEYSAAMQQHWPGGETSAVRPATQLDCTEYLANLRQVYKTAQPPTWDPLPQCQNVKLAMIKEKGRRYGSDQRIAAESRVEGKVANFLTLKVPVDPDGIFDAGTFDDERQVILVEGVGGMGKTSLAYEYAKKWAEGKLSTFNAVALVRLRDLNEHDVREVDSILPHLLFLASGYSTSKEMAQLIIDNYKVLFVLDGWDESPMSFHESPSPPKSSEASKPSFLKNLLKSVSPKTKILITSRPDFSLDLHSLANRVEILGFTKADIHDYFENALKSHLPNSEVKSACDKLSSHFHRYPVIESCCYVPLNAAILAYIYLNRDQSLPITRSELFQELVLCCIVRELETRQPDRVLEDVSSFEDLPADLKEQLHKLSELAFNGMMQNKIVFTQKEVALLSTLGLLHSVQGFGSIGRKLVTSNFIHLAVQELLAAYHISQLESAEHRKKFKPLLDNDVRFPVLQFYAGLTRLANEGVRNLITELKFNSEYFDEFHDLHESEISDRCFLAILNCIFEAQIHDWSFFEKMVRAIDSRVNLHTISLSPMDCLSVHYFLSSIRFIAKGQIFLNIRNSSIDDQCLRMLLGLSSENADTSSAIGVLESVDGLYMSMNNFTDIGIAYLVRALGDISDTNLRALNVGSASVTDTGLIQLLEVLPRQQSLEYLVLIWSLSRPHESLKKIGECVEKINSLKTLRLLFFAPPLQSEEAAEGWIKCVIAGASVLLHFLVNSQVDTLLINVSFQKKFTAEQILPFLHRIVEHLNLERKAKALPDLDFNLFRSDHNITSNSIIM